MLNDGEVKSLWRQCFVYLNKCNESVYDRMNVDMQFFIYPCWKVGVEWDSFPTFRLG